jgi:DNA polymerase III subunit delta'
MVVEKQISVSDNSSNQKNILSELETIIKTNKIPNALLFTGGNRTFLIKSANNFVTAVNCLKPLEKSFFKIPCSECRSCKKILADMHPDILRIKAENKLIKISAIRSLYQSIISKPNEANIRAVIIEDADTMNEQAQNAFLKMLEEPPSNTFFLLIADNLNSMLPTIISRCRKIWFKPIEKDTIEDGLDCTKDEVNWSERKEWLIKEISNIILNNQNDRFIRLKPLLLAEKLSKDQALLKDSLSIIRSFLRDIAVIRYSTEKINNVDYSNTLENISNKISLKKSILFFKNFYEAERKNQANPSSIRINLESLFLKIAS